MKQKTAFEGKCVSLCLAYGREISIGGKEGYFLFYDRRKKEKNSRDTRRDTGGKQASCGTSHLMVLNMEKQQNQ